MTRLSRSLALAIALTTPAAGRGADRQAETILRAATE